MLPTLSAIAFLFATALALPAKSNVYHNRCELRPSCLFRIALTPGHSSRSEFVNHGPWGDSTVKTCLASHNCEVRHTGNTTEIVIDYSKVDVGVLTKRDSPKWDASVTVGRNNVSYGSISPGGTYGAVHHLYDFCSVTGSCDSTPFTLTTTTVTSKESYNVDDVLTLNGQAAFPGTGGGIVDALIETIAAAAQAAQVCGPVSGALTVTNGLEKGGSVPFTFTQCVAPSFYAVDLSYYNAVAQQPTMIGSMQVLVTPPPSTDSGASDCAFISGLGAAIVPLVAGINPAVAAILGAISALCSSL